MAEIPISDWLLIPHMEVIAAGGLQSEYYPGLYVSMDPLYLGRVQSGLADAVAEAKDAIVPSSQLFFSVLQYLHEQASADAGPPLLARLQDLELGLGFNTQVDWDSKSLTHYPEGDVETIGPTPFEGRLAYTHHVDVLQSKGPIVDLVSAIVGHVPLAKLPEYLGKSEVHVRFPDPRINPQAEVGLFTTGQSAVLDLSGHVGKRYWTVKPA